MTKFWLFRLKYFIKKFVGNKKIYYLCNRKIKKFTNHYSLQKFSKTDNFLKKKNKKVFYFLTYDGN